MKGVFVTGTDTDVGKTLVSAALVRRLAQLGRRVGVMKPIETGALTKSAICGTLYDLCKPGFVLDRKDTDITLFKGVGHALEDLAAAKLALSSITY